MRKIFITTDSTAEVIDEFIKEFSLSVMRFSIYARSFCAPDGILPPDAMLDYVEKTEKSAKTVIVPHTQDYEDLFDDLAEKGDVVHISQGSAWSSAYKNALTAAKNTMVKFRKSSVFVLDSRGTATGQALVLDSAIAEKSKGSDAAEIFALCDDVAARTERFFIIPDAKRFNKIFPSSSGSIAESAQKVVLALFDSDGKPLPPKTCSSIATACKTIAEAYVSDGNGYPCYVYGSAQSDPLIRTISALRKRGVTDIRMNSMGAADCCLLGKDAVSVAFIGKPPTSRQKQPDFLGKATDFFTPEED